jgi:hypothetical protein
MRCGEMGRGGGGTKNAIASDENDSDLPSLSSFSYFLYAGHSSIHSVPMTLPATPDISLSSLLITRYSPPILTTPSLSASPE